MKDLPKVPTWRLEQNSNPRPFGRKASILPMCHYTPQCSYVTRTPRHHHISPVLKSLHWPRAHPLQCPVPNLQLPAVLSTHMPSQTLHHPPNPLYPIILLSHPFSASSGSRRRRSRRLLTTAHFNILRGGTLRTEYSKLISNKLEIFFN